MLHILPRTSDASMKCIGLVVLFVNQTSKHDHDFGALCRAVSLKGTCGVGSHTACLPSSQLGVGMVSKSSNHTFQHLQVSKE